jgi:hypothetical protein
LFDLFEEPVFEGLRRSVDQIAANAR